MKKLFLILMLLSAFVFGGDYQPESKALFARMSPQPDNDRKFLIDSAIRSLIVTTIWDSVDAIYFLANFDSSSAILCWNNASYNLTEHRGATFVADSGFIGDAGGADGAYLNTHYNPSTDSVNYTKNDALYGVYAVFKGDADDRSYMGTTDDNRLRARNTVTRYNWWINSDGAGTYITTTFTGLVLAERTAAAATRFIENGSQAGTAAEVGNPLYNDDFVILGYSDGDLDFGYTNGMISFAIIGGSLSDDLHLSLFTIVEAWMDAVGCGVVAGTAEFPYPSLYSVITFDHFDLFNNFLK